MKKRACAALLALLLMGTPACPMALADSGNIERQLPAETTPVASALPEPEGEPDSETPTQPPVTTPSPEPTPEEMPPAPPAQETPGLTPEGGEPTSGSPAPTPEDAGCNTIEKLAELVAQSEGGTVTVTAALTVPEGGFAALRAENPVTVDLGPYGITVPAGAFLSLDGPVTLTGDGAPQPLLTVYGGLDTVNGPALSARGEHAVAAAGRNNVYQPIPGAWTITSTVPFKTTVNEAVPQPEVGGITQADNALQITFDNLDQDQSYCYDLILERKEKVGHQAEDTVLITAKAAVENGKATFNLDGMNGLPDGTYFPVVVLYRQDGDRRVPLDSLQTDLPITHAEPAVLAAPMTIIAKAGGNETLGVSFEAQEAPEGSVVEGYRLTAYEVEESDGSDDKRTPASVRLMEDVLDGDGKPTGEKRPKEQPLEYYVRAEADKTTYDQTLTGVQPGKTYAVGVIPVYGETFKFPDDGKTKTMTVTTDGQEAFSSNVEIQAANPPALTLTMTGGNLVREGESEVLTAFAGTGATLTASTAEGSTVTVKPYTGGGKVPEARSGPSQEQTVALDDLNGTSLLITATNSTTGDTALKLVTVNQDGSAPTITLDAHTAGADPAAGTDGAETIGLLAGADGSFAIRGATEPGAMLMPSVGTALTADRDGRFAVSGTLPVGADQLDVTLTVSDAAGNASTKVVTVLRAGSSGAQVTGITLTPEGPARLNQGDTLDLQVLAALQNGTKLAVSPGLLAFTVDPASAATVDGSGKLTVNQAGTAQVRAQANPDSLGNAQALTSNTLTLTSLAPDTPVDPPSGGGDSGGAGNGNSIAKKPEVKANQGGKSELSSDGKSLFITLANGYRIKDVRLNGVSQGRVFSLTDLKPTDQVEVVFEALPDWINPFADVSEGSWYYDAVSFVQQNQIFNGIGDGSFGPDSDMTRAMLVTVLHRLRGAPDAASARSFADVPAGVWYTDAARWAAESGITSGYGDGRFGPDDSITREQMAQFLYNFAKSQGQDMSSKADLAKFSDADQISTWAVDAVSWANAEGLLNGKDGGRMDPTGRATRAEVAQVFSNFLTAKD